jgi:2-polyprenyl-3-methyl-5-hydroxy-6-metoxy-1,4-benzoquinol methylase
MIGRAARRAADEVRKRGGKLLSLVTPYEPMAQGRTLLDSQYAAAEWDYLRSLPETPRFGVVAAYCHRLAAGRSVLEVGCGEGILLDHLNRSCVASYTGVDISSVAIDRARALSDDRTTFVCAPAEKYVPEGTHQVIVFTEVMEYFDDPLAVVQRYEQFLADDGRVIISMFAGIHTSRSRRIWNRLATRYETEARAKVSTQRDHLWNIRVLRPPHQSVAGA